MTTNEEPETPNDSTPTDNTAKTKTKTNSAVGDVDSLIQATEDEGEDGTVTNRFIGSAGMVIQAGTINGPLSL